MDGFCHETGGGCVKSRPPSLIASEFFVWSESLIRFMPGRVGNTLRRVWFRRRFKRGGTVFIGVGCEFISPEAMRFEDVVGIGRNSFFAAEGGSISVGDNTAFNENAHVNASAGGHINIGKWCLIGPNVVMRTAGHRYDDPHTYIRQQGHIPQDISIGDDVWIGANAVILGGVHIGKGAVIGAGAVVTKNIPSLAVAVGVPARVIKYRGHEMQVK